MWGQKWNEMIWNNLSSVPALGGWGALLLGCLLGIVAVVCLRSARKVGLAVTLLMLLVPLSALAGLPFTFTPGTVADAAQVNANFAAVIPIVGKSHASGGSTTSGELLVFPSASFVAPRDLTCAVTFIPYMNTVPNFVVTWRPAMKIGTTVTVAPTPGPFDLSLVRMPATGAFETNYSSADAHVFSVPAGSAVAFGARFFPSAGSTTLYQVDINAVYSCTLKP